MIIGIISILILALVMIIIASIVNIIIEKKKEREKEISKISFKESLDLTELPIITLMNNNKKLNFLLDTGSNISYINNSLLPLLDYEKIEKEMDIIGIEGNKMNSQFCKLSVSYKNQLFEEEFSTADLEKAFNIIKQESGVQIHGILGSKFFEKYKYVLNFKECVAYIS